MPPPLGIDVPLAGFKLQCGLQVSQCGCHAADAAGCRAALPLLAAATAKVTTALHALFLSVGYRSWCVRFGGAAVHAGPIRGKPAPKARVGVR